MRLITLLIALILTSCQLSHTGPKYPVTPNVAAESTFKITVDFGGLATSSGTAWTVAVKNGYTYFITAGHVCDMDPFPGIPKKFQIINSDDDSYNVEVVAVESDDEDIQKDLCLLRLAGHLGNPLMIARFDPKYNDPLAYVGAPAGAFGNGLAPTYTGVECGGYHFCGPTTQGASGSAIFTRDGVIGVLVRVNMQFKFIVAYVSREALLDFLHKNGL